MGFLLFALPALGDVYFKSETRFEQSQGKPPGPMAVEGWVKGEKGKFLFTESESNPMMPEGSYLITEDGGRTFVLVNDRDKTWAVWDIEAMLRFVGSMMNSLGPLVKMEINEPQVELLSEEKGDSILGLPTTHYRIRTAYDMKVKVIGIKQRSETETVQDLWTTQAIEEEAFGAWLRKEPPKTGNEELDKLVSSEIEKTEGFLLRSVSETVSVSGRKGNKRNTSRSITEITELDTNPSIPNATFTFPREEYQQVEMAPLPQDEEGGNPLKGLFGGGDGE
jgi:hypothetical protein